jgi:adenylate cyclase
MDQDEIKLYVCEDGAWSLAERYGGAEGDKAVGEAKLSLRAAGVEAVKVVHSRVVDRQQKHDSLYRVVKAGAKPPPDPDPGQAPPKVVKAAPARSKSAGGAARPAPRGGVLPPISSLTAPKPQTPARPRRKKIPTGQRLAMAGASGSVAAVAGPVLMSSNIAADALAGTAGGYMVYLTAMALFLATFSTVLYVTGRIGQDPEERKRKKEKAAKGEPSAASAGLPTPTLSFEEAMGMALEAKAEPFAFDAAQIPGEEEEPSAGATPELAQHKKRLLEFLQQCLTEAATKKYLPRGELDAKARFGFHLFMLGAGQSCLAALPQSLKIKLADLVENALTALGSDPAKARAFADGIDSYRGDAKHAAMIRAGTDAMAGFLKDNKLAGSVLSEALKIWNMVDRDGALGADAGSQDVAIMFTDMVSSVETTQQIGDEGMMKLVEQHNLIVGAVLKQHRGHQVKHTGDGVMAVFPRVVDGVTAAAEIQRQIAEFNAVTQGALLKIRIGLSAGNPIRKDDDYFGTVVQTAARVCPVAGTGEVALPEAMTQLPGCDRFIYSEQILVPLKGFSTPQPVRKLLWSAGSAPAPQQARTPEPADAG